MEVDQKEAAKVAFSFAAVPFLIVVSKSGQVLGMGDPRTVDYVALLAAAEAPGKDQPTGCGAHAESQQLFSLDEDF